MFKKLKITKAIYCKRRSANENEIKDVMGKVKSRIENNELHIREKYNTFFGDPCVGARKELEIKGKFFSWFKKIEFTKIYQEDEEIKIPKDILDKTQEKINWVGIIKFALSLLLGVSILVLVIISFSLNFFKQEHSGSGDNVMGDKITYNLQGIQDIDKENLFYHDSVGRYYTAEEKDYLELTIGYSESLMNQEKYGEAIQILEKAIQKDFTFYGIWINLGNAYLRQGSYDNALNNYEQAINRNPNSRLAWSNRCLVLQALNKNSELDNCLLELSKLESEE